MRFESPDTERGPAAPPLRNTVGPVLFSVVLHGVVLGLFVRAAFAPEVEARSADERRYVRIAMVVRQPPPAPENLPQIVEEVRQAQVVEEPEAATAIAGSAEPAAVSVSPDEDPDEESASTPGLDAGVWTPARIRAAIETTSGERRSTVTEAWVIDCILEKKETGMRDCEEQQQEEDYLTASTRAGQDAGAGAFAGVTRPQQQARLVEQFTRQNALVEGLMAQAGGVSALAADQYFLNREYIFYLTGNGQNPVFAAMGNFTADPLAGPPLSLPGDILFSCKNSPCIYDYTGFKVARPEAEPEEGEFRVVPALFGNRH